MLSSFNSATINRTWTILIHAPIPRDVADVPRFNRDKEIAEVAIFVFLVFATLTLGLSHTRTFSAAPAIGASRSIFLIQWAVLVRLCLFVSHTPTTAVRAHPSSLMDLPIEMLRNILAQVDEGALLPLAFVNIRLNRLVRDRIGMGGKKDQENATYASLNDNSFTIISDRKLSRMGCAAELGRLSLIIWMHGHLKDPLLQVPFGAARGGQLDILKWAQDQRCEMSESLFDYAASGGHLETIEWLEKTIDKSRRIWQMYKQAAFSGQIPVLQWLQTRGYRREEVHNSFCVWAAMKGKLNVLQWALREHHCPWDQTGARAARGGHLELLQWALQNGCPYEPSISAGAALHGQLHVLKWLRERQYPWDERTCAAAADTGHLEIIKWARANNCPWGVHTCHNAALHGHLEILKWARANGCPWNANYLGAMLPIGRQYKVYLWGIFNGIPMRSIPNFISKLSKEITFFM